jgi:2-amino-4-hydroxy-6-hydroxymethyldihydropteridine diphosphokinase
MTRKRHRLAYIGLGSNLNEPHVQVKRAMAALDELPGCHVAVRSSLYRSAPLGPVEQADFVNAVIALQTTLSAESLLRALQGVERSLGREPTVRWGPRVIDLDLLLYDDATIDEPHLKVPHPGIAARNFVLLPLRQIAPDLNIPGLGRLAGIEINEREPAISLMT